MEHLKTLVVESGTSVLEEKPGGVVLQGHPELTLPELAGKGVCRVRDEGGIRASRAKPRAAQPIHNQILCSKIISRRLDRQESEAVDGEGGGSRSRPIQGRSGKCQRGIWDT